MFKNIIEFRNSFFITAHLTHAHYFPVAPVSPQTGASADFS